MRSKNGLRICICICCSACTNYNIRRISIRSIQNQYYGWLWVSSTYKNLKFKRINRWSYELILATVAASSDTVDQSIEPRLKRPVHSLPLHNTRDFVSENSSPHATLSEADSLLNIFREEMYSKFPFVVVPPTITAEELRRERPFLYNTIMAWVCI